MGLWRSLFGAKPAPEEKKQQNKSFGAVSVKTPSRSLTEWKQYFDGILWEEFPEFTVKQDVSATELCAALGVETDVHPACTPLDFLLYKEGKPYMAIVLVKPNTYRGMNVRGTKNICEQNGVKYVHFFITLDNERAYVIERMRSNI